MLSVVSFPLVISFSLLVTRIASVALVHTGLSREAARFQARSVLADVIPYTHMAGLFLSNFSEALSSSLDMLAQGRRAGRPGHVVRLSRRGVLQATRVERGPTDPSCRR